jgi:pimeloyl-ACP methyl ester carboxylesterase
VAIAGYLAAVVIAGFVNVNGHEMHYVCTGKGSPTVVLDSGSPETTAEWRSVQPAVARLTRVCSYDRAGLGSSAPAPKGSERTGLTQVRELRELLTKAHIRGPYVIVGHSWGGLLAQLFANAYRRDVAGAVLLDPTAFVYGVPPRRRLNREGIDVPATVPQLARVKSLGRMPLVVLGSAGNLHDRRFEGALDHEASLSADSVEAIAPDSTHELPYPPPKGRPDLVARAIESVVRAGRAHRSLATCRAVFGRSVVCR